jgi:hypothetical protein
MKGQDLTLPHWRQRRRGAVRGRGWLCDICYLSGLVDTLILNCGRLRIRRSIPGDTFFTHILIQCKQVGNQQTGVTQLFLIHLLCRGLLYRCLMPDGVTLKCVLRHFSYYSLELITHADKA